jgi:ABC-type Fe3+/spermidine/putrescine transport system ATPase subunit
MATLEIAEVGKSFGAVRAVDRVSLVAEEGSFTAILGPSGCGKTTLLRLIAGLESADAGRIAIGGRDVTALPPEKRGLGMMFQSYALMPHMNVAENVAFPLRMQRIGDAAERARRVAGALELVRLSGLDGRYPRQLSGGQQQRVALARAIITNPPVLLLDEPLSNLDAQLRREMQVELIELQRKLNLTTVFVTHDQEEALSLADRVVLMRDGGVEQQGPPEAIYRRPETAFAARFIGAANLLEVEVARDGSGGWSARFDGGPAFAAPAPPEDRPGHWLLALRQESLAVAGAPDGFDVALPVAVVARIYQGANARFVVELAGRRITVLAAGAVAPPADRAYLCWNRDDAILLPAD